MKCALGVCLERDGCAIVLVGGACGCACGREGGLQEFWEQFYYL